MVIIAEKYFRINYLSTLSLLEYARVSGARFIQISSYTYGVPKYQPIDENHPVNSQSPYAASKAAADQIALSFYRSFKLPVKILSRTPSSVVFSHQSIISVNPVEDS